MKEIYGYFVTEDGKVFNKRGKELRPSNNGRGYLVVGLMFNGKRNTVGVHRLVATAYLANPLNLREVNHRDGDKLNNCLSNLEWCTRGENIAHAYKNALRSATGTGNSRCLTDEDTVIQICLLLKEGHSCAYIRDLGYKYELVRRIKAKINWKHISDTYF